MRNAKPSSKLFKLLTAILLFIFLAIGCGPMRQPAGLPITFKPTATAVPSNTPVPPAPTATLAPTPTPAGLCGNSGALTLLFAGTGTANDMHSADAVRLIKVNFDKPSVVVVAFPRDLLVQTPALADLDIAESLLGPAFDAKREAVDGSDKEKDAAAVAAVAQILTDNFGVTIDRVITINVEPWGKMIDTLGGVEMELPAEVTLKNGLTLPAGKQVLNGTLAKEYVRSLFEATDADRINRQTLFVKALQDKFLTAETLLKLPTLLKEFNDFIATDLSVEQIISLGCASEKIQADQITFFEIKGDLVTVRDDGAIVPKTDETRAKLAEVLQ